MEDSPYLNDTNWIYNKICGSNCFQILEDIQLLPEIKNEFTKLLKEFLERYSCFLNYDGRQFYSHLYTFLNKKHKAGTEFGEKVSKIFELTKNPPVTSLIPLNDEEPEENDIIYPSAIPLIARPFELVVRIPETNRFVISVSTTREEICVWDIKKCERIRTLKGIPQPANLIPIDQFRCIVLCKRELRIYDLNTGTFKNKLKGVMNQKMPYFGLHDRSHLVALSRNRMYVNLMNIESGQLGVINGVSVVVYLLVVTGDCVTTFKAGEDRFLNSLLVSGDGRILVCGDETQKPFPLLVWSLQSKKLLYDLRIPHHDFITSLSAITHEGTSSVN